VIELEETVEAADATAEVFTDEVEEGEAMTAGALVAAEDELEACVGLIFTTIG
jgi:hypothetical protein